MPWETGEAPRHKMQKKARRPGSGADDAQGVDLILLAAAPRISTPGGGSHPREANPRQNRMATSTESLNQLINAEPSPEHFEQYRDETHEMRNDRGAAILLATNLENALQRAIARTLQVSQKTRKELFGLDSPVGTFSYKIIIAEVLRIIGPETRANLDTIRRIRNVFAHAKIPVSFETPAIIQACARLKLPALLPPLPPPRPSEEVDAALTGRRRYQTVCENTASNLIRWEFTGPLPIDSR